LDSTTHAYCTYLKKKQALEGLLFILNSNLRFCCVKVVDFDEDAFLEIILQNTLIKDEKG